MKDWQKVNGSQPQKPNQFDTTSSPNVVYQRRNITTAEYENYDGSKTTLWEYEERQLTHEEYLEVRAELLSSELENAKLSIADLENTICDLDMTNS